MTKEEFDNIIDKLKEVAIYLYNNGETNKYDLRYSLTQYILHNYANTDIAFLASDFAEQAIADTHLFNTCMFCGETTFNNVIDGDKYIICDDCLDELNYFFSKYIDIEERKGKIDYEQFCHYILG